MITNNILIVEDNDINATVLTHFLKPYNGVITRVVNGQQAIDFVRNNAATLILMDINMPVLNGCEATQIIRAMDDIIQPHIIAVTADITITTKNLCESVGMDGFLAKPYNKTQLNDLVAPILSASNQTVH